MGAQGGGEAGIQKGLQEQKPLTEEEVAVTESSGKGEAGVLAARHSQPSGSAPGPPSLISGVPAFNSSLDCAEKWKDLSRRAEEAGGAGPDCVWGNHVQNIVEGSCGRGDTMGRRVSR